MNPRSTDCMETKISSILLGESPAIRSVRALIAKMGPAPCPVLIEGPTGSGKELVAEALHVASGRTGDFVAFNVCAIPETMFEDAVFGHVKGAFTDARDERPGYLAEANGGTILLDEIGGLALGTQTKLLRAIERKRFRQIGGRVDRASDFRLIAAANESLASLVSRGRFREDLWYRLRALTISVPPLRQHLEDVPLLVRHFTAKLCGETREEHEFAPCALRRLQEHDWPGNVRELRNVVESALVLSAESTVSRDDVEAVLSERGSTAVTQEGADPRNRLEQLLELHDWNTADAATALKVHRGTVYRWMRRMDITVPNPVMRNQSGSATH